MVSPENITNTDTTIITTYDTKMAIFVFVDIGLLAVKNNVMIKYGAMNALVKKDSM